MEQTGAFIAREKPTTLSSNDRFDATDPEDIKKIDPLYNIAARMDQNYYTIVFNRMRQDLSSN